MPQSITFKVSKTGVEAVEPTFVAPENMDDERWKELVSSYPDDIHSLALQNLIIKIQGGARSRLEGGLAAVQEYVDAYKFGQRGVGAPRKAVALSAEDISEGGFSPEQLEMLAKAGVAVPTGDEGEEG